MVPKSEGRGDLKRRVNISIADDTRDKARLIGGGNVSRGIAIAVSECGRVAPGAVINSGATPPDGGACDDNLL